MLMIRMARFGAKKKPTYRVVVIDKERARDSRAVEVVGFYNPVSQPPVINFKHDRVECWLKSGPQRSREGDWKTRAHGPLHSDSAWRRRDETQPAFHARNSRVSFWLPISLL